MRYLLIILVISILSGCATKQVGINYEKSCKLSGVYIAQETDRTKSDLVLDDNCNLTVKKPSGDK